LCDRNRLTLDVGANRGMYSAAALHFSKGVIAFEPQSHLAGLMRKCLPRTVEIMECAVSHSNGLAQLLIPIDPRYHAEARVLRTGPESSAMRSNYVMKSVPTVRLDDVIARPVGLIKIDVEGHGLAVLQGASRVISASRPNVIIELEDRHEEAALDRAREWFTNMDYEAFWVNNGRLTRVPLPDERPSAQAGAYVYNFIFMPAERAHTARSSLRAALSAVRML
jgi:FkbM family methyltransferase